MNRKVIMCAKCSSLLSVLFIVFGVLVSAPANAFLGKKEIKTITVLPETAKIYINGSEVGNGSYQYEFDRNTDFIVLKFVAPGYLPKTVKLFKDNPQKTVLYQLNEDEAYINSIGSEGGIELANKAFTIVCKQGMDKDEVWKRLMNIAVNHFEDIEVRDKSAGWIRSGWFRSRFMYQTVRTRIEIRAQFTSEDEQSYRVKIQSQIADNDCGLSDQCFSPYDRLLKKFESVISELQITLGSNL